MNPISKEKIELFVDNLLKNENINITIIPDSLEKKMYVNILTILLQLINESLKNIKITILDHTLSISMNPSS